MQSHRTLSGGTGSITFLPHFLEQPEADAIYTALKDTLPFQQFPIRVFNRTVQQPRLVCFLAQDTSLNYTYSQTRVQPTSWLDPVYAPLLELKLKVERQVSRQFNSVLCNWYRDGQDYMGYHSDDEKELRMAQRDQDQDVTIASVSLGASRRFTIKPKPSLVQRLAEVGQQPVVEYVLGHGSLLVMGGSMQTYWKHAVPKMAKVKSPRLNLTFRNIY